MYAVSRPVTCPKSFWVSWHSTSVVEIIYLVLEGDLKGTCTHLVKLRVR